MFLMSQKLTSPAKRKPSTSTSLTKTSKKSMAQLSLEPSDAPWPFLLPFHQSLVGQAHCKSGLSRSLDRSDMN